MTITRSELEQHANDRAVLLGRAIGLLQVFVYCPSGPTHDKAVQEAEALLAEWEIHVGELFR